MAQTTVGLARIGQIAITVRDLSRAVAYYRDTLGMAFLFQVPGLAFFDCGGIRLALAAPEGPGADHPASIIYYRVDDLPRAYAAFTERGVTFIDAPHRIATLPDHELWMAFF